MLGFWGEGWILFRVSPVLTRGLNAFQTVLSLKLGTLKESTLHSKKEFWCGCKAMQPCWFVLTPIFPLSHAVLYYCYFLNSSGLRADLSVLQHGSCWVGLCLRASTTLLTGPLHLMAVSTLHWSQLYWWLWCNFTGLQPTSVTWGRLILGTFPQSKEICQGGGIAVLVTQQPTVTTAQSGGCSWPLSMAPMCLKLQVRLVNCSHPAWEIAAF